MPRTLAQRVLSFCARLQSLQRVLLVLPFRSDESMRPTLPSREQMMREIHASPSTKMSDSQHQCWLGSCCPAPFSLARGIENPQWACFEAGTGPRCRTRLEGIALLHSSTSRYLVSKMLKPWVACIGLQEGVASSSESAMLQQRAESPSKSIGAHVKA